jgi:predicted transcriptional regulator
MDRVMTKDRDEESGRYTETYPLEEFISALRELGGAASTQEVADSVGCAYRTAHAKLSKLEEQNKITSKKVGNAKLWQSID